MCFLEPSPKTHLEVSMDISSIDYISFRRVIERGTAEIIEEGEDFLFLYDSVSETYMLACDDAEAGKALLDKYEDRGYELIETTCKEAAEYACDRFGFDNCLECWQFAYLGEAPEPEQRLRMRTAELSDLPALTKVYDQISEDEMARDIRLGNVLLAYEGDKLAGFIGEHLEGSIGMLYVFPEFRRKGYAAALENAEFAKMIRQGFIPFGQVITGNTASYNLQKKRGLTEAGKLVYWCW